MPYNFDYGSLDQRLIDIFIEFFENNRDLETNPHEISYSHLLNYVFFKLGYDYRPVKVIDRKNITIRMDIDEIELHTQFGFIALKTLELIPNIPFEKIILVIDEDASGSEWTWDELQYIDPVIRNQYV